MNMNTSSVTRVKARSGAVVVVLAVLTVWMATAFGAPAVRIGTREDVSRTMLVVDETSGNLFAVLRYDDGIDDCFSVNLSTDGGESWTESYERRSAIGLGDEIGAAIVGDFLYVAYVSHGPVQSAKFMRFDTTDGSQDSSYSSSTVFSAAIGHDIEDVKVCSNVDSANDHLYFFAILENELKYFWSDEDGGAGTEPWNEIATGVTNAWMALDVTANENAHLGSGENPLAAFAGTGWELYLWRYDGTPEQIEIHDPVFTEPGSISISAFEDSVILTYTSYGYDGLICVSPDAGDSFSCETMPNGDGRFPNEVVARNGGGFSVAYAFDSDPCMYRRRDYSGTWTEPQPCTDASIEGNSGIRLAALPPYGEYDYGGLLISSDGTPTAAAYFFVAPLVFVDGFEGNDTTEWSMTSP